MHERDYQDVVGFNRVKHGIRKDAGQTAVNFVIEHWPTVRRFNDLLYGMFYRGHEPELQSLLASCVIAGGFFIFG